MSIRWLTRDQIKQIVKESLKEIADFDDNMDIDEIEIVFEKDTHKLHLIHAIVERIKKVKVYDREGNLQEGKCFNVSLNIGLFDNWSKYGDLVDYIIENQVVENC